MSGYKRIAPEIKAEVLGKVKIGEKVMELAKQYGLYHKTIYRWIQEETDSDGTIIEVGRLKRENDSLLKMVGMLTMEIAKMKKK